jgi:hypothetical protein
MIFIGVKNLMMAPFQSGIRWTINNPETYPSDSSISTVLT